MNRRALSPHLPEPTDEDLERIAILLRKIGGRDVRWGAEDQLNVWVMEHRARLDQQTSERIRSASWALVLTTVGLVAATVGLIWATLTLT